MIECIVQSEFPVKVILVKQNCWFLQPISTSTGECTANMTAVIPTAGLHCVIVAPITGESVSCQARNNHYEISLTILKTCHADIAPSGVVDVDDLLLVINSWGPCEACPADLMPPTAGNGIVDVDDLLAVINLWGPCE